MFHLRFSSDDGIDFEFKPPASQPREFLYERLVWRRARNRCEYCQMLWSRRRFSRQQK